MIQRIQTIWLLLAGGCFLAQWIPSMAMLQTLNMDQGYFADRILYVSENYIVLIASGVSGLLALISVFLYKERTFQILLSALSSFIQLLFCIGTCFYLLYKAGLINDFSPDTGLFLSMAGIVFIWLASRAIRRDQEILKSMDRLR